MKTLLLVSTLALGAAGAAFAQSAPPDNSLDAKIAADFGTRFSNGRATTIMKEGEVMTKITMPAAAVAMLRQMMKDGHDACMIAQVSPSEADTVVLVCGAK